MSLGCGYIVSSCHDGDLVIKCGSNSQQVDPDKFESSDFSLALSKRIKFQEAAKKVRLDNFKNFNNAFFALLYSYILYISIYILCQSGKTRLVDYRGRVQFLYIQL